MNDQDAIAKDRSEVRALRQRRVTDNAQRYAAKWLSSNWLMLTVVAGIGGAMWRQEAIAQNVAKIEARAPQAEAQRVEAIERITRVETKVENLEKGMERLATQVERMADRLSSDKPFPVETRTEHQRSR